MLVADVVVLSNLSAAQVGEEAFDLIGVGAVQVKRDRVIDPIHLEVGVQAIPMLALSA